jgi:hypothetical protein
LAFRIIENVNPKPPVDGSGRLLSFVGTLYLGTEQASSLGAPNQRCFREYGSAMAIFFSPSNVGASAIIQTIDTFRRAARGQQWSLAAPSQTLEIEAANPASDYASLRWNHSLGDYFTRAVICSYRHDFLA